jgi:hypothetical protein
MKQYKVFILLAITFSLNFWQQTYAQIEVNIIKHYNNENDSSSYLEFPIIASDNPLIKEKINTFLQAKELHLLVGHENKHIFERCYNNKTHLGKASILYTLISNTTNNFSFRLKEEINGLTVHNYNLYYNFNPKNGDVYYWQDFFDSIKKQKFIDMVAPLLCNLIPDSDDNKKILTDTYQKELTENFYLTKDSILFDIFNDLYENEKYNITNTTIGLPINKFKHLLNEYGYSALISGKNLDNFSSSNEEQLYKGITNKGKEFYFTYLCNYINYEGQKSYIGEGIYTNTNKIYFLDDGNYKDSEIIFHCTINNNNGYEGLFSFKREGNNFKGKCTNKKGKKQFTFTAKKM